MQKLGSITAAAVSEAPRATGWKEQTVEEYGRSLPGRRADLRAQLAARLLILTGRRIPPEDIYTDTNGRLAATSVDHMCSGCTAGDSCWRGRAPTAGSDASKARR